MTAGMLLVTPGVNAAFVGASPNPGPLVPPSPGVGYFLGSTSSTGCSWQPVSGVLGVWIAEDVPGTGNPGLFSSSVVPSSTNFVLITGVGPTVLNGPTQVALAVAGTPIWYAQDVPSTSAPALYSGGVTPGTTNYALASTGPITILNATSQVALAVAGTAMWYSEPIVGGTTPALYSGVVSPTSTNFTLLVNSTDTVLNAPGSTGAILLYVAGAPVWAVQPIPGSGGNGAGLFPGSGAPTATNYVLSYNSALAASTALNSTGFIGFANAGNFMWEMGAVPGAPTLFGLFPANTNPSAINYAVASDGNTTVINAPNGSSTGIVGLSIGGTDAFAVGAAGFTLNSTTFSGLTSGTVTLSAAEAALAPLVYLEGTVPNLDTLTLVLPASPSGAYLVDITGLAFSGTGQLKFGNSNGNLSGVVITSSSLATGTLFWVNVTSTTVAVS